MTEKEKHIEYLKKGIADYSHEQKLLLRLIRMSNGLTQTKFDELFMDIECRKRVKLRGIPTMHSFILGMGINGGNEWAWHLDLLQIMMEIGLVDTKRNEKNEIVYILPKEDVCHAEEKNTQTGHQ